MQMPIPDDWDGESTCRWAICWPNSIKWKAILYGLIGQPYQGRFWDRDTGNIVDTQHSFYPMYLYNFDLKGVIMACDDTGISTSLNNIAASIALLASNRSGTNCCNTPEGVVQDTIQNTVTAPISGDTIPLYGSEPPLSLPPGEFPDNYDTLEAYLVDKCRIANMVADGFILSIRGLGALTVFNITTLAGLIGLAMASIIIFPPTAIPIMITAIIALSLEIAVLIAFADFLEDRRDEIVCILYNSDGVEAAIAVLADFIDSVIALLETGTVAGTVIKTISLLLLNSDTLNQLFSGAAALGYPDVDCSSCECDILTYDFTDNDNGYDFASDSCFGTTPSSAGSSVTWSSSGLRMAAPNVGSANFVNAAGPSDLNIEIQTGWELVITGHRVADFANFTRVDCMLTEDGCTQLQTGGFTALTDTQVISSLDTWVGKHIEQINLFVGNSIGQDVDVEVVNIMIRCAE